MIVVGMADSRTPAVGMSVIVIVIVTDQRCTGA